ncbi:hypothetical protein N0O92_01040 [Alkalihalobacillus sp. MEB130]|uniref:hypothetical protein n=1 Tax=Alkalihalobacillus sp. MEB130 TaxID=2976704 RepID=UPI0028DFC54D|nr:hypothetical protein [Alkalihalobacillus sp. MEB130]MDT8858795.1 hypothetical protein [Alkalihalobacillus sp. MEB130]
MIKKYAKVWFAAVFLLVVLMLNTFFDLPSGALLGLFAFYLVSIWVFDVVKMKAEEKKGQV